MWEGGYRHSELLPQTTVGEINGKRGGNVGMGGRGIFLTLATVREERLAVELAQHEQLFVPTEVGGGKEQKKENSQ